MEFKEDDQATHLLWTYIGKKQWSEARQLLADDFEADWPQSREKMGPDGFLEVNRNYPGTHIIRPIDSHYRYDRFEKRSKVVTQTNVESEMPDGKKLQFYALSFFEVQDAKILSLVEYWAETYPAPDWRKQWVERY